MCRHIHSIRRHKTKHIKKADLRIWVDLIKPNSPLGCLKVKTHQWQTNKWHSGVCAEVVVTVKKVLNSVICQKHFLEGPEEPLSPVERQWHRCAQQHQNRHDTLALYPSHRVHGVLVPGWFHDVKSHIQCCANMATPLQGWCVLVEGGCFKSPCNIDVPIMTTFQVKKQTRWWLMWRLESLEWVRL